MMKLKATLLAQWSWHVAGSAQENSLKNLLLLPLWCQDSPLKRCYVQPLGAMLDGWSVSTCQRCGWLRWTSRPRIGFEIPIYFVVFWFLLRVHLLDLRGDLVDSSPLTGWQCFLAWSDDWPHGGSPERCWGRPTLFYGAMALRWWAGAKCPDGHGVFSSHELHLGGGGDFGGAHWLWIRSLAGSPYMCADARRSSWCHHWSPGGSLPTAKRPMWASCCTGAICGCTWWISSICRYRPSLWWFPGQAHRACGGLHQDGHWGHVFARVVTRRLYSWCGSFALISGLIDHWSWCAAIVLTMGRSIHGASYRSGAGWHCRIGWKDSWSTSELAAIALQRVPGIGLHHGQLVDNTALHHHSLACSPTACDCSPTWISCRPCRQHAQCRSFSERGDACLGIMMTPNLDLRWDHIAILASSSWLEPKKFALTACLLWWFSCDSHLGFLETYFLFRISSQHLTTHFVNHIIVVPLHMSTFFVPGIPARSGHPGVFEELQNDGEGQEGQAWGVLLHLEASQKNRNSHFLKTVHFFI